MKIRRAGFRFNMNVCPTYVFGMLSHDDKDYELWLSNKGTLPVESQRFGHWI